MNNRYVDFISDEHLTQCIANLHNSYLKAKGKVSKKNFYKNKVDTIKLTFDAKFNGINEDELIQVEVLRQIDKSINNSIGTFHEQVLGGVDGYEIGQLSGFDIKAGDNSLFAVFQFEELPFNFEYAVFEQMAKYANIYKNSMWYFVDFFSEKSYCEKWRIVKSESSVSHKKVFRISADQFYDTVTREDNSLNELMRKLPEAISDYLELSEYAV